MSQGMTSSIVVHVRENSGAEMEALFKVVADPHAQEMNKSIPFRDRNLPASFFQQPGLHPINFPKPDADVQKYVDVGPVSHLRAHSSPANMQQAISRAPASPHHQRQRSCELLDDDLPLGWSVARTPQGQRYFLNHVLQSTTWHDPRNSHSPNSLDSPQHPDSPASGSQTPPDQVNILMLPLPSGWERSYTANGELYFINHIDRSTSWFHPSLPPQQQRLGMPISPQLPTTIQEAPTQHHHQQLQHEQQQHIVSQVNGSVSPIAEIGSSVQRVMAIPAEQQHNFKLKQLQMEMEHLRKRQEEIKRQEMIICKVKRTGVTPAGRAGMSSVVSDSTDNATELTSVADPFLHQVGSNVDHSRQESADSGLGGMGTAFSIPRTSDDFLSNMEDMEISDVGPKVQEPGDFGAMDITSVCDSSDCNNMDSEDLVPSLQEDISSELLRDVESVLNSSKAKNLLTWL